MYQVKSNAKTEIVIKNSKFIGLVYHVQTEDDIKEIINELKETYKDYTHLTYAWKLINKQKSFDDGEPGGTAGMPILEVINKNELVNTLIVVIRYFGGIKLGAGGLIRAYSKAAREALKESDIEIFVEYNFYELTASYDDLRLLNTLAEKYDIIKKDFNEEIKYKIKVAKDFDNAKDIFKYTEIKIKKL